jgi:cyclomaltodextrinase
MRVNVTPISSGLGLADVEVDAGHVVEVRGADGVVVRCAMSDVDGAARARVMARDAVIRVVGGGLTGEWQHLETRAAMETPDWAKGATWYQLFPERFANGNAANDPRGGDVIAKEWTSAWYPGNMREEANIAAFGREVFKRRYGGDLEGVVEHLDHLQALGVNAIYLNPLFDAESLHKYDASDYRHVDPTLAGDGVRASETGDPHEVSTWTWTSADRYFVEVFLPACKQRGMRVVIDGVFNHVGRKHWAFQDVVKNGRSSAYADWFVCEFDDEGKLTGWQAWDRKDGWLPEFRQVKGGSGADRDETVAKGDLNAGAKKHILDITRRWMDPNGDGDPRDGVDGWRLDVAGEVGDAFWRDWRRVVKGLNPDALIVAEIWHNASDELRGETFDTQMFYPFAYPLLDWLTDTTTKTREAFGSEQLVASWEKAFVSAAQTQMVHQTLVDSHDTERVVNMLANPGREFDRENRVLERHHVKGEHPYVFEKPGAREYALQRVLAAVQATYVGSPMIYYGAEIGMWGADDPCCRIPMAWHDVDAGMLEHYRSWMNLRRDAVVGPVLRYGGVRHVASGDADVLVFERYLNDVVVRVTANRATATVTHEVVHSKTNRTP